MTRPSLTYYDRWDYGRNRLTDSTGRAAKGDRKRLENELNALVVAGKITRDRRASVLAAFDKNEAEEQLRDRNPKRALFPKCGGS